MAEKVDGDQRYNRFDRHALDLSSPDLQHHSLADCHNVHWYRNSDLGSSDFLCLSSPVQGRVRSAIGFIIDPLASAAIHTMMVFMTRKARISRLDKYEDGRLWLYNGFGQLVTMDLKNREPRMIDERRLRIALKKGQVELRTENSADIGLIISVLSQTETTRTVDC